MNCLFPTLKINGLTAFILIIVNVSVIKGDNTALTIKGFDQKDCTTFCMYGLNNCTDRIVMKAKADWDRIDRDYQPVVNIEFRKCNEQILTEYCSIKISECRGNNNSTCYCEQLDSRNNIYTITLNTTAEKELSEADIVLTVKSRKRSDLQSNPEKLPKIYGCSDVEIALNGRLIDGSTTTFALLKSNPNIQFCCFKTPMPCLLTIQANGKIISENATGCATFHQEETVIQTYILTYSVCSGSKHNFEIRSKGITGYITGCHIVTYFLCYVVFIM